MIRKLIVLAFVVVVLGGLYVSRGTFETVAAMALTARDIFFSSPEKPSTADPSALTGLAAKFSNSLITMDDGAPHPVDPQKLAGVKYWAFYYSASWCPPCRVFTPGLVAFYREFKPFHPDFDLIFVSYDHNQDDMLGYMKGDMMPWLAVSYGDVDNSELEAKKYAGAGIPCLVLVDNDGHILSDTFVNGAYTDPHHVIEDIKTIVK